MRHCLLTLVLLAAASTAACHDAPSAPAAAATGPLTKLPRALSADEQVILSGSNAFAFNLFAAVDSAAGPDSNVFISPLSASMALGMTTVGAHGATLDSMQQVLGYAGMSVDAMAGAYQSLIALLQSVDTNVTFKIANAIWYEQGLPVLPAFASTVQTDFHARLQAANFSDPTTVNAINAWVDSSTEGKISALFSSLPSTTLMALLNAIYFHGGWTQPFDVSQTSDTTFTTGTGSGTSVSMMHVQTEAIPFVTTPAYTAVDIPYGRSAYRMTVILPNSGVSLDSVTHEMRGGAWPTLAQTLDSGSARAVNLGLPKFQLTWGDTLNTPLTSLGMGIAFSSDADFSNLATGGTPPISEVVQKTYIQVDETGTTAAAVTGVGIATALPVYVNFTANTPFLYVIRERFSGAILFIGAFTHPPTS